MGRSKVTKNNVKRSSHGSILKYFIVLIVLNSTNERHLCHSLKLNPVQPLPLLPLIKESESMKASFDQAKEIIQAIRNELQETRVEGVDFASTRLPPDDIRTSGAIKILSIVSNRWKSVEHKYMSMVSNNRENATLFHESLNDLSIIKLLLANVYLDTNAVDLAIEEYESACPIIMSVKSYHSYDTFDWIDCLSRLSNLYFEHDRYEDAVNLGESLVSRMPWLSSLAGISMPSSSPSPSSTSSIDDIDHGSNGFRGEAEGSVEAVKLSVEAENKEMKSTEERNRERNGSNENSSSSKSFSSHTYKELFAIARRISEFTLREKRMLSAETSKAWLMAERMRIDLREAVKEFTMRDGNKDLQTDTFRNTDKFVKTMLNGYLDLTPEQIHLDPYIPKRFDSLDFSDLYPDTGDPTDLPDDSIEITEKIKETLYSHLKRECFLYLNTMKGVIDKGRNYVPAAIMKAKEFENEVGGNRYVNGPQGFLSIIDVLELFKRYQNEAMKHINTQKMSRPSAAAPRVRTDEKASFSSASKIKKATTNSDDDTTKNEEVSFDPWDILNHVCNNWFYLVSFVALFTSYGQPSSTKQRTNARHIKAVISISGEKEDGTRGSKKSLMSFIVHSFKNRLSIGVRNIASISIFFTGLFHTVVTASGSKLEPLLNTSKRMNKKPLEVDINAEDLLADLGEDHKSARNGPTSNSPKKSATAQKNKKNNYIKRGNNICENIKKNKVELYTQKVSSQTEPRFEVLSDDYTDDVDDDGEWITMDHHKSRSPNNNRVHPVNNGLNGNMVFQSNRKISKDAPPVKEEDKNLLRSNNIAPCTLSTPSVLSDDLTTVSNEKASYESVAAKNQKHDKYKDCEDSDAISSDGMGSTSDESEDTHIHDSTPRARNLNIETIVKSTSIATSPARVSHHLGMNKTTECVSGVVRDHDSLGTHNKTEKLRKLLSISTTTPSSAIVSATKYPVISEPIRQSNPPTVDGSCNAPVSPASMTPMQIVVLPQPNGTGILMMMGIDGLCYPIPSGVFPDQSQYSEYSVASQRIEVVNRIRIQIEFYFSPQNLVRDTYLKSLMDENGYVRIEQIMPFNRIKQLMADPYLVLEAVQTSRELDIDEPWAVKAAKGDVMATRAINPSTVLTTRIRCLREPLKWVPPKTS